MIEYPGDDKLSAGEVEEYVGDVGTQLQSQDSDVVYGEMPNIYSDVEGKWRFGKCTFDQ